MAAFHAKQLKVNDCILLNDHNMICDTTIANIFIIKDDIIYTPPLSEGCVAGVIRRFLIEKFQSDFKMIEKPLSIEDLQNFDDFKNIFQLNEFTVLSTSKIYKQKLTHQTINGQFFKIEVKTDLHLPGYDLLSLKQINKLPFPKFITAYLKD